MYVFDFAYVMFFFFMKKGQAVLKFADYFMFSVIVVLSALYSFLVQLVSGNWWSGNFKLERCC